MGIPYSCLPYRSFYRYSINHLEMGGEAVTPKPSDSMRERARDLAKVLYPMYCKHFNGMFCDVCAPKHILAALTDAFNLGAGGMAEAAAQRCEKNPGDAIGRAYAKAVREATSADALAAIERKVSKARLKEVEELHHRMYDHMGYCHTAGSIPNCLLCERIAKLEAEGP